jgi:2-dehydro-3-deoxyphosphogluconate aldolase/(4S)-4-hydroxy-2-oxoglutarate aldolase
MADFDVYRLINELRVVPVISIDSVEAALPLADALIEGGLPIAEITFRTAAAADVISILKKERRQLLLGAGTILTVEQLSKAKECGAQFAVAPGLNPNVLKTAVEIGLPFSPGVMTPSDIETALSLGAKTLKFFPAEAAGGLAFLKDLSAPYKHLDIKFIPTGGVNTGNMAEYLAEDIVLAVGGTWVAKSGDIKANNWEKIKNNCKAIREAL